MKEFKVGDRAKVRNGYYKESVVGQVGTVKCIDAVDADHTGAVGIEFENCISGHDGTPKFYGKDGHCWFVDKNFVIPANSTLPTIVITSDGKTTTATMRSSHKVLKEASVSLYYKDKFSLSVGTEEALKKLFGKQERVKEVKRPAKAGDYIKLIREPYSFNKAGDILRVDGIAYGGSPFVLKKNHPRYVENGNEQWYYSPSQYVVLENYKPQEDK